MVIVNESNIGNLSKINVGNLSEGNVGSLSEINLSNANSVNDNGEGDGVNFYGSIVSPDDAPFGPADEDPPHDFEMSESSALRKRPLVDVSSDDGNDDVVELSPSASPPAEAPKNNGDSKVGPRSKAKKSEGVGQSTPPAPSDKNSGKNGSKDKVRKSTTSLSTVFPRVVGSRLSKK